MTLFFIGLLLGLSVLGGCQAVREFPLTCQRLTETRTVAGQTIDLYDEYPCRHRNEVR
jgi:hypothetical protein